MRVNLPSGITCRGLFTNGSNRSRQRLSVYDPVALLCEDGGIGLKRFPEKVNQTMVTHPVKRRRSGVLALAAGIVLGAAASLAIYEASVSRTEKFQELADNAAIAGVNALVRTEGLPDAVRLEAARIAASNVVAAKEPAATVLAPTTDGMTMSVTLTKNATGKGSAVTAKARYVEPGGSVADDKREDVGRTLLRPERG